MKENTKYIDLKEVESKARAKRFSLVELKQIKLKGYSFKQRRISSPLDLYNLLEEFLNYYDRERVVVLCLNTKNEPICIDISSIGSINMSIIHPREVFKNAILVNASKIIIAHNHPSGDITPSKSDDDITDRLVDAGKIIGIDVIEHMIVGENEEYYSYREHNKI